MTEYSFQGNNREPFQAILNKTANLLSRWGYVSDANVTSGYAEPDFSKENNTIQLIDSLGTPVFMYEFKRVNGLYKGKLKINLPPHQASELEKIIQPIISQLKQTPAPAEK